MSQQAFNAVAAIAPEEHSQVHENVVRCMASQAPQDARGSIGDLINRARSAGIPWGKILAAITIAAAGGFTPQAIAAAIASLFGTDPAPAA